MFLAGPLVEELKEEVASSSPLDSRRMLELLVPLVYRPAMKVSRLPTKTVTCMRIGMVRPYELYR